MYKNVYGYNYCVMKWIGISAPRIGYSFRVRRLVSSLSFRYCRRSTGSLPDGMVCFIAKLGMTSTGRHSDTNGADCLIYPRGASAVFLVPFNNTPRPDTWTITLGRKMSYKWRILSDIWRHLSHSIRQVSKYRTRGGLALKNNHASVLHFSWNFYTFMIMFVSFLICFSEQRCKPPIDKRLGEAL